MPDRSFGRLCFAGISMVLLFAGCDGADSAPVRTAGTAASVPQQECVDGLVTEVGVQGAISAGPLASNHALWRLPQGTKFWVASTREQPADGAVIEVKPIDAPGSDLRVARGPEEAATVSTAPLFYPGALRIPQPGRWRIVVTIGADRGCFVVAVD